MSPSGLARKAGLNPTTFNPSKRVQGRRKRWPSTESISDILKATGTEVDEFIALARGVPAVRQTIPLIGHAEAGRHGYFDEAGYPVGHGWEEVEGPFLNDPHAFALEISGKSMEPIYREGDRVIVSPAEKPRRGDRVIVRTVKGEVMAKQMGRETALKIELISLNPSFPSLTLSKQEITWIYRIVWASQ